MTRSRVAQRTRERAIEVCANWAGLGGSPRVGVLHATPGRGGETFAFEYDPAWLAGANNMALDPRLQRLQGRQYAPEPASNFGLFLDSAPDRWGRMLMRRREARTAILERRAERPLVESDYLLGVFDPYRLGALRFRVSATGPFLAADATHAAPPWTSLRALEHASRQIEQDDGSDDSRLDEWLSALIAPGASLGGARPKAGVVDERGRLWIAKFPSSGDEEDIGLWEFVVHSLAKRAGLDVAPARLLRLGSRHHTFIVQRFDRTDAGARLHFASAMTLLERNDGDDAAAGASYVELAELLMRDGARTDIDLEQLWRRIVFFLCVSNVDDHLRNHGFMLTPRGWRLAPAYDMNPVACGHGLTLNVSETDNALSIELALSVAPVFRVQQPKAKAIVAEVVGAVREWRAVATANGASHAAQTRLASAFRLAAE